MKQSNRSHRLGVGSALLTLPLAAWAQTEPAPAKAALVNYAASLGAYTNNFYPAPPDLNALRTRLLMPTDLVYRGAFRFPATSGGTSTFSYVAGAMTFYPKGDAQGASDGYPGSLFVAGHIREMQVAEVDIPKPVISSTKKFTDLPVAKLLNPFRAIGALPSRANPVMGLSYMPAQGSQDKDKLYVSLGDGYLPSNDLKTYWMSDLDFTNQVGPFRVGDDLVHCYSDYMFPIPQAWSEKYAGGRKLMTGRHREGDLCGRGPALFAISPWSDGNPPALDKPLSQKPVLRYKSDTGLVNYSRGGDIYMDGAFLESDGKSALVMIGQKGMSDGEYGTYCNFQGFHDLEGYRPYLIFYDTDEIGRAANGEVGLDEPQPYAAIDLNEFLLLPNRTTCDKNNFTAASFDPATKTLYLLERAKDTPAVHVFSLQSDGSGIRLQPSKHSKGSRLYPSSLDFSLQRTLDVRGRRSASEPSHYDGIMKALIPSAQ